MDEFDASFFYGSENGANTVAGPPLLEEPLDDHYPYPPIPVDDELMNMKIFPKIEEYHENAYIDPSVISLSSGVELEEYQGGYNGESSGAYIDPPSGIRQGRGQPALTVIPFDPALFETEQNQQDPYRNAILNSFASPLTPLRVIDEVNFPFEQTLQLALEVELEREKERDLATMLRKAVATPARESSSAPRRIAPLKKPGTKRPDNIRNFNAEEFYCPLRSRPASWGSINLETGDQLFQYTENGELNPLHSFTVQQMIEFIHGHPLHNHLSDHRNSDLKLWVQTVPADSGRRYPHKLSDKCRFADCPDSRRTIRKGDFRIAFDERPHSGRKTDPFHNAGYVHLYCIEKFLDFPLICEDYNVLPDTRNFREGKNKMAITRDHQSMAGIVREFMELSKPWKQFGNGRRPEQYYQFTLCSALTDEHLLRQPKRVQETRDKRNGNSIDVHKNNLDFCLDNAKILKANKKLRVKAETKPKMQKRKAAAEKEEESALDENILASSPRPKRLKKESVTSTPGSAPSPKTGRTGSSGSVTRSMGRKQSVNSTHSPKERKETRPRSIPIPKRRSSSSTSSPSPKKCKHEDVEPSPEPKRRRSPRSPKSRRTFVNISWDDDFHVSGLPF